MKPCSFCFWSSERLRSAPNLLSSVVTDAICSGVNGIVLLGNQAGLLQLLIGAQTHSAERRAGLRLFLSTQTVRVVLKKAGSGLPAGRSRFYRVKVKNEVRVWQL